MSLRFILCDTCQRHGRFVGDGGLPMEVASHEMFRAALKDARNSGALDAGDLSKIEAAVRPGILALKEDGVDDELRQRVALWNLAAATTNDPCAFADSGFHDYHDLVDGFGHDDSAA